MKEELGMFKDQEQTMIKENQQMTSELSELKLQLQKVSYESKENAITTDSLKETNQELAAELEELKKNLAEMRLSHKSNADSEKEKKKAEKMAHIFSGFDASVSSLFEQTKFHHMEQMVNEFL
jgi:kinesin family protein 5